MTHRFISMHYVFILVSALTSTWMDFSSIMCSNGVMSRFALVFYKQMFACFVSQENICTERRRSTPLKSADSTIPALLMNRKGATPDLAHITPIKHPALVEPWTPTANLKMLISAASPDIRDREMKKVLFRPIENEKDTPASPDPVMEDTEVEDSCQVREMV